MFSFRGASQKINNLFMVASLLFMASGVLFATDYPDCPEECNQAKIGNYSCNSSCNLEECGYDGGDCCNSTNNGNPNVADHGNCKNNPNYVYGYGCDCLDPDACNNDEGYDDWDYDCEPSGFEFNTSTQQGFYYFSSVSINGEELSESDWIGAFIDGVCVGARQYIGCSDGVCDVPVFGDDGNSYSEGYATSGDIPTFMI